MISAIEQLVGKVSAYLDEQGFQKSHYYETALANRIYSAIDAAKDQGAISFVLDTITDIQQNLTKEFNSVFSRAANSGPWLLNYCEPDHAEVLITFTEAKVLKIKFQHEWIFDITCSERILADLSQAPFSSPSSAA